MHFQLREVRLHQNMFQFEIQTVKEFHKVGRVRGKMNRRYVLIVEYQSLKSDGG